MNDFWKRKVLQPLNIGIILSLIILIFIENFAYSLNHPDPISTKEDEKSTAKIPTDASEVSISYDNKYYTYLQNGKIYINEIEDEKNKDIIKETEEIVFHKLLDDKNVIFYVTKTNNNLTLKNYTIDTKKVNEYNNIKVTNFKKVKDLAVSTVINIIYLNVETTKDTVYRVNIMNTLTTYLTGSFDRLVMLKLKDGLLYEQNGYVYQSKKIIPGFKKDGVRLLGHDEDDNIYLLGKTDLFKVANNEIIDSWEVTNTDYKSISLDGKNIHLIFDNFITHVNGDDPDQAILKFDSSYEFIHIVGEHVYFKNADNELIKKDLK